ncbi:2OG-Fe(II) oxygenase [Aliiglaciecola litoralis]|uniref:Fe2OG dioxygenase domain-containing protein n=1 Tax=Aliiglaciecola litoralis TaxID=582857 RepID=A0ABN1LTL3_9ALTE
MAAILNLNSHSGEGEGTEFFEKIAKDIQDKGFSINPCALPHMLGESLAGHLHSMPQFNFEQAGIGRESEHSVNNFVRTDDICWITGESDAGRRWLEWNSSLQTFLNRRLFLGLFSFESHFAHYSPGDFYKRHFDAFKGEANRVLSVVVYLNHAWQPDDGGELVIYQNEQDQEGIKVTPSFGTMVVFLSEEFPHEVLPASRDRFSIASWYRVNSSTSEKADPPA